MTSASARPDNLDDFAATASGVHQSLLPAVGHLTDALDAFRSTVGWSEFLDDIPPLDIDAALVDARIDALGEGVAATAAAFRLADSAPGDGDGLATIPDQAALGIDTLGVDIDGPSIVRVDGRVIVDGTDGADHVQVIVNDDGTVTVRVGVLGPDDHIAYEDFELTADEADALTIRTGGENDVIEVPPTARIRLTVWAGDGDDLIGAGESAMMLGLGGAGADRLFGGRGNDTIFGGAGRDRIYGGKGDDVLDGQDGRDTVIGGGGRDMVYGGRGDDTLTGGDGDDFLEGGSGDDHVAGDDGDDIVSGGRGDDDLAGGDGDDRLLGGRGDDRFDGGRGDDHLTVSDDDTDVLPDTPGDPDDTIIRIALEGSPGDYAIDLPRPDWMTDADYAAWTERIDGDLELIRTTPDGRAGLEALDDAARDSDSGWKPWDRDRRVVIVPYGDDETADAATVADWLSGDLHREGDDQRSYSSPPGGDMRHDSLVRYDHNAPGYHDNPVPGVVVVYHEAAHAYDQISGGTPNTGPIDYLLGNGTYREIVYDRNGPGPDDDTIARDRNGDELVDEVREAEWNAVGHDTDGDGDFDTLDTEGGRHHPGELTENALRDDLGLDRREYYRKPVDPDQYVEFEDVDR